MNRGTGSTLRSTQSPLGVGSRQSVRHPGLHAAQPSDSRPSDLTALSNWATGSVPRAATTGGSEYGEGPGACRRGHVGFAVPSARGVLRLVHPCRVVPAIPWRPSANTQEVGSANPRYVTLADIRTRLGLQPRPRRSSAVRLAQNHPTTMIPAGLARAPGGEGIRHGSCATG